MIGCWPPAALDRTLFGAAIAVKEDDSGQVILAGDVQRRSLYAMQRRSQPVALMQAFDAPAMQTNCEARASSTVATQSLMLMNGDFWLTQAATRRTAQREPTADLQADLIAGLTTALASRLARMAIRLRRCDAPRAARRSRRWHIGPVRVGRGAKSCPTKKPAGCSYTPTAAIPVRILITPRSAAGPRRSAVFSPSKGRSATEAKTGMVSAVALCRAPWASLVNGRPATAKHRRTSSALSSHAVTRSIL